MAPALKKARLTKTEKTSSTHKLSSGKLQARKSGGKDTDATPKAKPIKVRPLEKWPLKSASKKKKKNDLPAKPPISPFQRSTGQGISNLLDSKVVDANNLSVSTYHRFTVINTSTLPYDLQKDSQVIVNDIKPSFSFLRAIVHYGDLDSQDVSTTTAIMTAEDFFSHSFASPTLPNKEININGAPILGFKGKIDNEEIRQIEIPNETRSERYKNNRLGVNASCRPTAQYEIDNNGYTSIDSPGHATNDPQNFPSTPAVTKRDSVTPSAPINITRATTSSLTWEQKRQARYFKPDGTPRLGVACPTKGFRKSPPKIMKRSPGTRHPNYFADGR